MPDTLRVDLSYRPLRIGWAVKSDDIASIRRAMIYSHALWGGRFNPILLVDHEEDATDQVESFRLDAIVPIGDDVAVQAFPKKYPHLIDPNHGQPPFVKSTSGQSFARLLDVANTLAFLREKSAWGEFFKAGLRKYEWDDTDPLADVFLMQLGRFPSPEEIGIDYDAWLQEIAAPTAMNLPRGSKLPADIASIPSRATIGRLNLERDYNVRSGWDCPGFFVGNAQDPVDLVTFWNIRACDVQLWFVDPNQWDRYADVIPVWEEFARRIVENRSDRIRHIGVWSRQNIDEAAARFPNKKDVMRYALDKPYMCSGGVCPPSMSLGRASALGVFGKETKGQPRISFALTDKPYLSDYYVHHQLLAVSISFIGGLYDDDKHTFDLPYVPELNEFFARTVHFDYSRVRVEPERIGLIVDANDHDAFLNAMPVSALTKKLFELGGFESAPSSGGRILRQLLTQLQGVQGARVFKIPGARNLLKKTGPRDSIARLDAFPIITDKSPAHRHGTFADHIDLHLGPRERGTKLTPPDVFAFLVERGLYRIGAELVCPHCELANWIPVDLVKEECRCELCGEGFGATRQLLNEPWRFRRSGILGVERNVQGAIPVALTLQQLDSNLSRTGVNCFSTSLDIWPKADRENWRCEIDFIWLGESNYPDPVPIVLGECKDVGPIRIDEFAKDVENLRRVADSLPTGRLKAYILLAKLAPFTDEEIALAKTLNGKYQERVIMLTAEELEPYHFHESFKKKGINEYGTRLEDLASITSRLYFSTPASGPASAPDNAGA